MNRTLSRAFHSLVGYLYMRLWHGKYHKRKLIKDFEKQYYYAGLSVIWFPVSIIAIIVFGWALIHVGITLFFSE